MNRVEKIGAKRLPADIYNFFIDRRSRYEVAPRTGPKKLVEVLPFSGITSHRLQKLPSAYKKTSQPHGPRAV